MTSLPSLGGGAAVAALRGKIALVTGAAGVIGAAIAKDLAAAGVRVGLVDISTEGLAKVAADIAAGSGSDGNGLAIACDLSDESAIAAAVATLKDADGFGMPDILVNVAGILSNNKLVETTVEEWQRVMTINVQSAFLLCQHCCPVMAERGWGRVGNITSWAWKSGGLTAGTAYSASKGAMTSLTFSVARQYVADGVTCNGYIIRRLHATASATVPVVRVYCWMYFVQLLRMLVRLLGCCVRSIAPCYIFGPMILDEMGPEKCESVRQQIPVKKFCTPEEVSFRPLTQDPALLYDQLTVQGSRCVTRAQVAHVANFLVSPLAGFITGEIIDQNGGFQMD